MRIPKIPKSTARPSFHRTLHGYDWLKPVMTSLYLATTAGCVTGPSSADIEDEIEQFASHGGYRAERTYTLSATRETWKHGYAALDIFFLAPTGPGQFPLIIYMPGLGEDAAAGVYWRRAWAQAGYAVLSVQPVALSGVFRSSGPMNKGDLRALGRRYFAQGALENRLRHLAWTMEELRLRSRSDRRYAAADLTHVAVAGFDLGAQAVAAIAGEKIRTVRPPTLTSAACAAIALSPYAALAEGSPGAGFTSVAMPLLAVTGTEDDDPYGIAPASLRQAGWKFLPPGDKFLLSLQGGGHALLSGAEPEELLKGPPMLVPPEDRFDGASPFRGEPPERLQPVSALGGMGSGGPPGGGPGGGMEPGRPRKSRKPDFRHMAVVRDVTTAFLDAVVKRSPAARTWLADEAARWMGKSATLKDK